MVAQKFNVQLSLLGEKFSNLIANIGLKLIPYINQFVTALGKFLDKNFDVIVETVTGALIGLADFILSFTKSWDSMDSRPLQGTFNLVMGIIGQFGRIVGLVIDSLSILWTTLKLFGLGIKQIYQTITMAGAEDKAETKKEIEAVNEEMARKREVIKEDATTYIDKGVKGVQTVINNFSTGVSDDRMRNNNSRTINNAR
jgi:hypothetical protein